MDLDTIFSNMEQVIEKAFLIEEPKLKKGEILKINTTFRGNVEMHADVISDVCYQIAHGCGLVMVEEPFVIHNEGDEGDRGWTNVILKMIRTNDVPEYIKTLSKP